MIDIIIPAYNAHRTIRKTLCSIAYQKNVDDLNVYIINDCSDKDYSDEVKLFSELMNIQELTLDRNMGPGYARQYGIDNSKSKYIVFIDSDDFFSSPYAIKILEDNIRKEKCDIVISNFYALNRDEEMVEYSSDGIFLHGKIYRRQFLQKNNIRFNNTRANEDNGFNQLVFLHGAKEKIIEDYTYYWDYNNESITAKNNEEYSFSGLHGYIYNMIWALEKAIEDGCDEERIAKHALTVIIQVYFYYLEYIDREEVNELLEDSIRLYEIYCEYSVESEEEQREIWTVQYNFNIAQCETNFLDPEISFKEFLGMINELSEISEK